jgi:SAM-dependent methyltransferase
MIPQSNPYDELPYRSFPIEWTAPERLAIASMLHGGPRPPLDQYRVLELGCGNGANLLPLAYYRRHGSFVGIDGAHSQIAIADDRKKKLGISNAEFIHADFFSAARQLNDQFDYIIAHGVFSWVSEETRDALLQLCAQNLSPGGLLYLNYNSLPGWNVRGMVRDFLVAQTAGTKSLLSRAQLAQEVAAKLNASFGSDEHPYTQLMAKEFEFVCENHLSYIAHEYLSRDNHAYWRSEFMSIAHQHKLDYVADADFNYSAGQVSEGMLAGLQKEKINGCSLEDTVDLLSYRQLHSPILTRSPMVRQPPDLEEFANLFVASCLTLCASTDSENPMFEHPSGYQVEAKEEIMRDVLMSLQPLWPRGLRVKATRTACQGSGTRRERGDG